MYSCIAVFVWGRAAACFLAKTVALKSRGSFEPVGELSIPVIAARCGRTRAGAVRASAKLG